MKVHEIRTAHVHSVAPGTTLVEAAGLMRELDVGALPVCDGGELTGIVTDRDIVVCGVADGNDPATMQVSHVMSGGVVAVSGSDDVAEAVRTMEQRQIRRVPVIDSARKQVGIVSLADVATSSNPAFGGMALRDVSEPGAPSAHQRRLARQSEPVRAPRVPGARHGPADRDRGRRSHAARRNATDSKKKPLRGESGAASWGRRTARRRRD